MYKMKAKAFWKNSAKECAYIGVFIAAVIAVQAALSVAVGIELVTVLFAAYAYVFGARRGMIAATAFSLLPSKYLFSSGIHSLKNRSAILGELRFKIRSR